jgi:hypothetical protein
MEIIFDDDDNVFYILTNKYEEKLGFFVLKIKEGNPYNYDNSFLIKWKNKLDIGDTNIQVLRNYDKGIKEIIISFKTININTFNLMVMDISKDTNKSIIFRHESFQLWESKITGLLLNKHKDYVTLNRDGINILALGSVEKRPLVDNQNQNRMIHSLESCNYLKIDSSNYLLFACAKYSDRQVQIQQEFTKQKAGSEETDFERIYNIKIWEITLRELLLFQSLYVCKTQSDIVGLVNNQPNPTVFYKSFLEFDGANMVSILSFDGRSMQFLLNDNFAQYFNKDFPIFYKNKIQKGSIKESKYFYRNAIDNALRNN